MKNTFFCIDAHTCGNPVRLVVGGKPLLNGASITEKRSHFMKAFDWIRQGLMFEPRGHDMMSGSMLYPPLDPQNDVAVLFIETSGCLPMCGHGTIGTVTIMLEEGLITPKVQGELHLETPAGLIHVRYQEEKGKIKEVQLVNVPSFLYKEGVVVSCPELGTLNVDIAYGGNFYAIIDPQKNFSGIQNYTAAELIAWSPIVRKLLNEAYEFRHPEIPAISGLSHIMWTGDTLHANANARNAVFYGDKAIDRSPCGTGTSARMAQWYAQGRLRLWDEFVHESYIGSQFIGKIEEESQCGSYPAIVPSIKGWAKIMGYNHIVIDQIDDPYALGFQVI